MNELSMKDQLGGVEAVVSRHDKELYGDGASLGISQKVNVLWRLHVWLLCLLSGLAGSGITLAFQKLVHP